MTNKEILKMDFYDLCGTASVFMTDQDKIDWWKHINTFSNRVSKWNNNQNEERGI